MGILDGIVDWLATQVMNLLDLAYYFNQFSASRLNICLGKIIVFGISICCKRKHTTTARNHNDHKKTYYFFHGKLLIVTLPFAVISLCIGITKPFHVG